MPTPIIKIDVDDQAFRRYLDTFNKYQEQLSAQPEMWKDVNEVMASTLVAGAAIVAEIEHQAQKTRRLGEEEKQLKESRDRQDSVRKMHAEEEQRRDDEALRRRKRAIEQVKEYSRTLADAAVSLGKWAVVGGGASLIGGALGLWGLDRLVGGAGQELRQAQGFGVSVSQHQGLVLQMQRYFDVNSVLGNVTTAMADPSQWATFKMMGINTAGKDPGAVTAEATMAARRLWLADRGNLALAQAQGINPMFSLYDLNRLGQTPEGQLKQGFDEAAKYQGLSNLVAGKWQQFTVNLDKAGLHLQNALIDRLLDLEKNGALSHLVEAFTDLGLRVLNKANLDDIAHGIEAFAKYIGSPKFQADFSTFVDDVSAIASKLVSAMKILGLIPETPGALGPPGGTPAAPGAPATSWPHGMRGAGVAGLPSGKPQLSFLGGGFAGTGVYATGAEHYASQQFRGWGWSDAQDRGLLANLKAESNFNPFAKGDRGAAYGIGQWHSDRQAIYAALFGHSMQSVTDAKQALREQIEFVQWELTSPQSSFKKAGDELKKAHSAYEAGYAVSMQYERPRGGRMTAASRGVDATVNVEVFLRPTNKPSTARVANGAAAGG